MILSNEMLEAAFRFRKAEPWNVLHDADVFAVRLSTGENGYCSVMGVAGEHYALGLYIGEKGFSTYLNMLNVNQEDYFLSMNTIIAFDCINCYFMPAKDMPAEAKKRIRAYAEERGMKIPRTCGWPDFTRLSPYKAHWCITREEDARAITEALSAAVYLASRLDDMASDAPEFDGDYPGQKGGKKIPLLIPQADGVYQISETLTPAVCEKDYPMQPFDNEILVHRLKKLNQGQDLDCKLFYFPYPVSQVEDGEAPDLPLALYAMEQESGFLFPPIIVAGTGEHERRDVLLRLANMFLQNEVRPRCIAVDDEQTFSLLFDFCTQCGIRLEKVDALLELNEAFAFTLQAAMQAH